MIIKFLTGSLAIWQVESHQKCYACRKNHASGEEILTVMRGTVIIEAFCDKKCMMLYKLQEKKYE